MAGPHFREIAHPADLCLQAWGDTRASLYEHAADALFQSLEFICRGAGEPAECRLLLEAPDPETLMVDWLSELLYQSEQQRACWRTFVLCDVSPTGLRADVSGQRPCLPRREVKAVTYTGLRIGRDEADRWTATVTFDI